MWLVTLSMLLPFHYGVRGNSKMRFLCGNHCLVRSASEVPGSLGSGILEVIGAMTQHAAIPRQRQMRTGLSYTRNPWGSCTHSPSWLSQEFSSVPSQAFATACPALQCCWSPPRDVLQKQGQLWTSGLLSSLDTIVRERETVWQGDLERKWNLIVGYSGSRWGCASGGESPLSTAQQPKRVSVQNLFLGFIMFEVLGTRQTF